MVPILTSWAEMSATTFPVWASRPPCTTAVPDTAKLLLTQELCQMLRADDVVSICLPSVAGSKRLSFRQLDKKGFTVAGNYSGNYLLEIWIPSHAEWTLLCIVAINGVLLCHHCV